jgi:hypothetical protein
MTSTARTARIAGAVYFLSAVAEGLPILYVPGALIVDGDAAATAEKIRASETLFRAGIASELVGAVLLLFVAGLLYRLLHRIDEAQASLMVAFVLVSVPIAFVNVLSEIAALTLVRGAGVLAGIQSSERNALAMFFLNLHASGVSITNVFWGLWLVPLGILVFKSRTLPWILGAWLVADGLALVIVSFTALLVPAQLETVSRFAILPETGELWIMLWLSIFGMKPHSGFAGYAGSA